jgi:D-alanyl-D-alanine carboxypeptidase-like protein
MRPGARLTIVALMLLVWLPEPAVAGTSDPFAATVSRLDRQMRETMIGVSWHPGCPVPLRELRSVWLTYVGFDGRAHHGRLIVHRRWADEIVSVFRTLYRAGFPIRRIRPIDRYGGDDRRSMRHDNTSAFNCRTVAGTSTWSQHAYGRAIDIDPVENPYVDGAHVSPPNGEAYADRSRMRPGMIAEGDVVWRAFDRIGWGWGGTWWSAQDYQHFSANGR